MSRDARRRQRALARGGSPSMVAREVAYGLSSGTTKEFDVRLAAALGSWAARSVAAERRLAPLGLDDIVWLATGTRSGRFVSVSDAMYAINRLSRRAGWSIEARGIDSIREQEFLVEVEYTDEAGAGLVQAWRETSEQEAYDRDLVRIGYDAAGWGRVRESALGGDRVALAALAFLRAHSFSEYCWLLSGQPRTAEPVRVEGWHEIERQVVGRLLGVSGRQEKPWLDRGKGWEAVLAPRLRSWSDELSDVVPAALWWLERGKKERWRRSSGRLCAQVWSSGDSTEFRVWIPRWPSPWTVREAIFVRGGAGVDAEGAILLFYNDGTLRVYAVEMQVEGRASDVHGLSLSDGSGKPVHVFEADGEFVGTFSMEEWLR